MTASCTIPYKIESHGWSGDITREQQLLAEDVISWKVPHERAWYPRPGRTLFLASDQCVLKVKGAGYYNPPNTSFSGLKRTTVPVPEGDLPMPPLQVAFQRDLIHVDPNEKHPHEFEAVHSTNAPIGGMTWDVACNDQYVFDALQKAGMPSNRPLSTVRYVDLSLDGRPMGVSVSQLPRDALAVTPYEIYSFPLGMSIIDSDLKFLQSFSGEVDLGQSPEGRLKLVSQLARFAGALISDFSLKAGLYRFSGSPDNWNMKADSRSPFFFSDVDTSRRLTSIPLEQRPWEVLRNLLTALHQWIYFFLPALTHPNSGYSASMLMRQDLIGQMLEGFFDDLASSQVEDTADKLWTLLAPALTQIDAREPLPLRGGEYYLQQFLPRPAFYLLALAFMAPLIEKSRLRAAFPDVDLSTSGVRAYIEVSAKNVTHQAHFNGFCPTTVLRTVDQVFRKSGSSFVA